MPDKILFIGAGAIACYLSAFLSRAGHDVTLVDAWAEQIETIRNQGIAVTGPHEPFTAHPTAVHLHEAQRLPRDFAIAFVALKVYDTAWATQLALRHLVPEGYVVAAQNCWPDPIVAAVAGAERAVGLVMSRIGVAVWTPGRVERGMEKGSDTGHNVFRAGEHDGRITPRIQELAAMLADIDGAQTSDNLWGERWAKLCANAMSNPVQALSGLGADEITSREDGRALTIHLAAESARVGLAHGYRLPRFAGEPAERWADAARPETWQHLDRLLTPASPSPRFLRASMAQDVAKGRSTEIDEMNGFVVAQGRECGIATPVSIAVVDLMHEIEQGTRRSSPDNIPDVLRRAAVED
ncbi:MAG TPA: 2-dehydropantoate 2-reductase [Thermomicrobiales bacterium]|nr:2-dehydropantoate 2-reductase [Thermomicrobiales bacterium]